VVGINPSSAPQLFDVATYVKSASGIDETSSGYFILIYRREATGVPSKLANFVCFNHSTALKKLIEDFA
jgi:hypothetical protein